MQFVQEKILVADDDESIIDLIALYLEKGGFQVIAARDDGEALSQVA